MRSIAFIIHKIPKLLNDKTMDQHLAQKQIAIQHSKIFLKAAHDGPESDR